jgi:hypothetical protein
MTSDDGVSDFPLQDAVNYLEATIRPLAASAAAAARAAGVEQAAAAAVAAEGAALYATTAVVYATSHATDAVARAASEVASRALDAANIAVHAEYGSGVTEVVISEERATDIAVYVAGREVHSISKSMGVRYGYPPLDAAKAAQNASGIADAVARATLEGNVTASAAEVAEVVREVADAAARTLEFTAALFATLAPPTTVDTVRRPGRMTVRLVNLAASALPAAHRSRYVREWVSLLSELPTRRERVRHVVSILRGAPHQGWVLRRPLRQTPPA